MAHVIQVADATQKILATLRSLGHKFASLDAFLQCPNVLQIYAQLKDNHEFRFLYQQESVDQRHADELFLMHNYIVGAKGEEHVITRLRQLSEQYWVINGLALHLPKAIFWREGNRYIRHARIDHTIIGPEGILLIETKNWTMTRVIEANQGHSRLKMDLLLQLHRNQFLFQRCFPEVNPVHSLLISVQNPFKGRFQGCKVGGIDDIETLIGTFPKVWNQKKIETVADHLQGKCDSKNPSQNNSPPNYYL